MHCVCLGICFVVEQTAQCWYSVRLTHSAHLTMLISADSPPVFGPLCPSPCPSRGSFSYPLALRLERIRPPSTTIKDEDEQVYHFGDRACCVCDASCVCGAEPHVVLCRRRKWRDAICSTICTAMRRRFPVCVHVPAAVCRHSRAKAVR